eukprot:TRINITY_DN5400_c0_g1_i2.p1 TRINITY_DN5400_c0_g1~~TRINITY_DN5400_c0_g1_i2.p1  ORF type:complete len:552 (+),score=59.51 TRINITY_DN5400_c0_g1_i2:90-1745(+)
MHEEEEEEEKKNNWKCDGCPDLSGSPDLRCGCQGCFCIVWLLGGPAVFLYGALNQARVIEAKKFATVSWEKAQFRVLESGVLYTGSCSHQSSDSSGCSQTCPESAATDLLANINEAPPTGNVATERRMRGCSDSYTPWIKVQAGAQTTCVSEFGLEPFGSFSDSSDALIVTKPPGTYLSLWTTPASPCVVALQNPKLLVDRRREEASTSWFWFWMMLPLSICAWLCFCGACCFISFRHFFRKEERDESESGFLYSAAAQHLQLHEDLSLPKRHWSQWDANDVTVASGILFRHYDANHSGQLDVREMTAVMAAMGIHDERLIRRVMAQLDHDHSGMLDEDEFEDFCRQVFWNGHQTLIWREYARQEDILGTRFLTASGLSEQPASLAAEIVVFACLVVFTSFMARYEGGSPCDVLLGRYIYGAPVLCVGRLVILGAISVFGRMGGYYLVGLRGCLALYTFFVLIYGIVGVLLAWSSLVCDHGLYSYGLCVALVLSTYSLFVLSTVGYGFIMAHIEVNRGTQLSKLGIQQNSESDSDYSLVSVENDASETMSS